VPGGWPHDRLARRRLRPLIVRGRSPGSPEGAPGARPPLPGRTSPPRGGRPRRPLTCPALAVLPFRRTTTFDLGVMEKRAKAS
jgi:hypothetical protein